MTFNGLCYGEGLVGGKAANQPLPSKKMKRPVILRGHPKKMGHNAMMTEPAQAVVNLDFWLLVLGSVIGSEAKNLKYFPGY
jgi:hypothetical protein